MEKYLSAQALAEKIDHTNLRPDASDRDIKKLCFEAQKYGFHAVCVNPSRVLLCSQALGSSPVKICTVVGFPLGANSPAVKAFEAQKAHFEGADEIDMVMNIGAFKSRDYVAVVRDIQTVKRFSGDALLKIIVETALLSRVELKKALAAVISGGADYIKTSTGYGKAGARIDDVIYLKKAAKGSVKIKAAGGIKDFASAKKFLKAGADRLGCSKSVEIIEEGSKRRRE